MKSLSTFHHHGHNPQAARTHLLHYCITLLLYVFARFCAPHTAACKFNAMRIAYLLNPTNRFGTRRSPYQVRMRTRVIAREKHCAERDRARAFRAAETSR
jgi:hypothetical protein